MPSFTKSSPFLRDLIDVALADEDAHSKVIDVFVLKIMLRTGLAIALLQLTA